MNLEVGEELVRRELASARVFAAGPKRRRAAVEVADVEVVKIDSESACITPGEDESMLAERAGRGAAEADDAMFPDAFSISDAGSGDLIATELIHARADLEERAEGLAVVAFERGEIRMPRGCARREGDVEFDPVGGVLRAAPIGYVNGEAVFRFGFLGNGDRDREDFTLRCGGRVKLRRSGLVAEGDAEGIGPGVHFGSEGLDDVRMGRGDVVRFRLVLDDVVEFVTVEEAVELPLRSAQRVLVAPDEVVTLDRTWLAGAQGGPDVLSVERAGFRHLRGGHRHEGRKHVERPAEAIPLFPSHEATAGPMEHGGKPDAAFVDGVLVTTKGQAAAGFHRAVVAGEDEDGVIEQAKAFDLGEDGRDVLIERMKHRRVDMLLLVRGFLAGGGELGGHPWIDGSEIFLLRLQRRVGDLERDVAEEGGIFACADEIDGVPGEEVVRIALVLRAELHVVPPGHRPCSFDGAAGEVIWAATVVDPGFVEAVCIGTVTEHGFLVRHVLERLGEMGAKLGCVDIAAVVPLSKDTGAIAIGLEPLCDGCLLQRQLAADFGCGAHADGMPPRQQHRTRWRADAPAHELREFNAL